MNMLNIGCGATFHPDWVNIDLGGGDHAISHNITNGIPFPDEMFDVVYHSHLLEHLPLENALPFIKECFRVLKPGGIVRILVPDLEQIARLYLEKLSSARESEADYDWIMLELYDQCVRQESGGQMERYLRSSHASQSPFVVERMGHSAVYAEQEVRKPAFKLSTRILGHFLCKLRSELAKWAAFAIAGESGRNAFREGVFRNSGEVHRWMYDRFSLGRLMTSGGFDDVRVVSPLESRIPDFARYELDVCRGVVRKPDSLVMEGVKL
ncbi:class I SAM-dependent methyltransferase [Geomobilimonas luticola]|uniref:Methyltransferase domain-containing protein n=1 Tax=Geomobilimonas luticola TaxID=1114878 RepID=A0ABS5SCC7_9BACT|nr:methyltransferase domain-containing protein [Geomobilimonas luticola]MBT0653035.1 methyltransferase domain-containing protein [Geomobilimonas luticola]